MAAIASKKGREQISNSRVSREILKLANNSEEVLPEGCKYAKCVQKDGDQNGEQFTIAISPSVFGGSEPVELMFFLSYDHFPFRPPKIVVNHGLEQFSKTIQLNTLANPKHFLQTRHLQEAQWTPAISIPNIVENILNDLRHPELSEENISSKSNNKNVNLRKKGISQIDPVAFTINDVIGEGDIPAALFLECEIEIGGRRYPRRVAINPHSIFVLESHPSNPEKRFVRSQRALLEIARVSYTIGKAVKVVYKASQGGDHVTFFMKNPIDCVKAISYHLKRLGIQGNEATPPRKRAQHPDKKNKDKAATTQQQRSPFFRSSFLGGTGSGKTSNSKNKPTPHFGGGGRNESPYASIKRLEKEMRARPTINVVRGIMDRYRRLIERCSADSRPRVQKQAEMLTRDLQLFLQRPEVLQTLSDQEQIEKQRHRRRDSMTLYDLEDHNAHKDDSKKGEQVTEADETALTDSEKTPTNKVKVSESYEDKSGSEHDTSLPTSQIASVSIDSPSSAVSEQTNINPLPGWRGTPYHRVPGEVYKTPDNSKSQINHSRVAETGTLLSGRVLVEVTVKPPPVARVSLFNNMFTSPPLSASTKSKKKNSSQVEDREGKKEVGGSKTNKSVQKPSVSPKDPEDKDPENRMRRPSVELLASMMGENYDDVLKVVGTKKDDGVANSSSEENLSQQE